MVHQLDHTSADAAACTGYRDGQDSVTAHRTLITCRHCRQWLTDPTHDAAARDLERRVSGK